MRLREASGRKSNSVSSFQYVKEASDFGGSGTYLGGQMVKTAKMTLMVDVI
jgi:hypothetical protein